MKVNDKEKRRLDGRQCECSMSSAKVSSSFFICEVRVRVKVRDGLGLKLGDRSGSK